MMDEVLELLNEYNFTCSFFIVATFTDGREDTLRKAVENGHELCNHGGKDIPYHKYSKEEFSEVFLDCEAKINSCLSSVNKTLPADCNPVNRQNNKWFRPPWGAMSDAMMQVLKEQDFRIAMSDCYGLDVICRPPYIADYTVKHARPGSVILLHMPSKGFREYNMESLRQSLAGLQKRGLQCVSLSELEAACKCA